MVRRNWNVEIDGQQHSIEIQLDTIVAFFATGSGKLLVDGKIVRDWGRNPFSIIPKGSVEFGVAGRRAFIRSKGTIVNSLVLVLGGQEIPPILTNA